VKGRRYARGFQWKRWASSPSYGLWRRAMVFLGRRIPSPPHQLHRFLQPAAGGEASNVRLRRRGEVLLRPEGARHPRASSPLRGSSPVVGIAPQAKHPLKEWPFRRYAQLAQQLEAEGVRTLWFLDPKRQGEAQLDPADCVRAPLEDAAGAMDGCDLVIAGDTGMGHLASALGIPVLVLYGSTVPELGYTPTGAHSVLQVDLPCRPCHVHGAKRCWLGHRRCLHEITPDLVFERVKAALGGSGGA
jgi:ADP-heptose:LPS heptosyltransferase